MKEVQALLNEKKTNTKQHNICPNNYYENNDKVWRKTLQQIFLWQNCKEVQKQNENRQNTVKLSLLKKITSVSGKDKNRTGSAGKGNRRKVILIHAWKGEKKINVSLFQLPKEWFHLRLFF